MNNITPIIEAEATKRINEYVYKGFSEEESINMALHKIRDYIKKDPLVAIHWEIQKALVIKLSKFEDNKNK